MSHAGSFNKENVFIKCCVFVNTTQRGEVTGGGATRPQEEAAEDRQRMSGLLPTGVFIIPLKVSWHRPIGALLSDQDQLVTQLVS